MWNPILTLVTALLVATASAPLASAASLDVDLPQGAGPGADGCLMTDAWECTIRGIQATLDVICQMTC